MLRRLFKPPTCVAGFALSLVAGCSGPQSALDPAGKGAAKIADLFWWMTAGSVVVWLAVVGLTIFAIRSRFDQSQAKLAKWLIIGGGTAFPTVVLAALLIYGLGMLPKLVAKPPAGTLKIAVSGEQWWWRVRYLPGGAPPVELANEIRLPVGEPVEFELESPDVLHSFWIPSLGGKVDMIPGRRNRLVLEPTRTGVFRGACAEYCGDSHAHMAFDVVVMEKAAFTLWLQDQRAPGATGADPLVAHGRELFLANGCSACHAIRGTEANGKVGPDLTHVGSRLSIGAGIIRNDPAGFIRWLRETDRVKPGVLMPHFGMLPPGELPALAAYLESLQ